MLDKEFQYFLDHQDELVNLYPEKYVTIVGDDIVGVHESETDAYFSAVENYELGSFLIQQCVEGKESYTQTFHSNIAF